MKRKYLIFLDIDGVFASNRVHMSENHVYGLWAKFDPVAVNFFNKLHDRYPVEFVVMSTWKDYLSADDTNIKHWVMSAFQNSGFRGSFASPWKTNPENELPLNSMTGRAFEVKRYLETYAEDVEDFMLVDDNTYEFDRVLGKKRLVRTDSENGLLVKHMRNALSLVGNWDAK